MNNKVLEITYGEYTTKWKKGPKGSKEVDVDVYKDGQLVLEWTFPKCRPSLLDTANALLEQAVVYAKNPPK